jgi:CTP:molybdopterin cytidylyltransferase MocA
MGQPKAGLAITHQADTFLARIIRTLTAAGLPDIVIVTGAGADAVRGAAGPMNRRVRFVHNPRWEQGQLTSLIAALDSDPLSEALLVTLVDVPFVSSQTVIRVLHAWRSSRAPIVRPASGDRHGHPVIFDRALFDELRQADPAVGAKAVVRAHEREILNVATDDPGAFLDVDTEREYLDALSLLRERQSSEPR